MTDHPEGIAIIGLAGRFPEAPDATAFWRNLVEGKDCLRRFTDAELTAAGYDPAAVRTLPGYVGVRGMVDRPEWFDREFFNMPLREAEVMDPQHRVLMEVGWEALEDAGCDPARFAGLIGVFAGMSNNTYFANFVQKRPDLLEAVGLVSAVVANEKDFLATRMAYKLNLRGPAMSVQTACSSSLVAVAVACQQLIDLQCDLALAGGVSITFPQARGYLHHEGAMTSPSGTCRPFDTAADGTVFSSGAGIVALKRLADALTDGDQIYAVIKGYALNNDGAQKVSFAAPSVEGQSEAIALAQAMAGFAPETVSYIETHGTATPLGDPIEIEGLLQAFQTDARGTCGLGSAKGNIGHLDAASGVAGLIKTALAFRHGKLPPTIHCESPNPALPLAESPFYLQNALKPWPRGTEPRRAGVSSFGVGGTNAHLALEEAPPNANLPIGEFQQASRPQVLVLSAKTASALEKQAENLAEHLDSHPKLSLANVAHTLQSGRQPFAHRRAVVASDAAQAAELLRTPARAGRAVKETATPVAFVFPGQGSQFTGMGAQLYQDAPVYREALDRCAAIFNPLLGEDLVTLLAESGDRMRETRLTQPAIFAVSFALAEYWRSLGVQPAVLVGHSVGEFVAATVAGVFSLEDAARVVAERARLIQEMPRGAMLAVRLGESDAQQLAESCGLDLAAVNSPKLSVLSGPLPAIELAEQKCHDGGHAAKRLETSHAFHSAMVDPVLEPLAEVLASVQLSAPKLPIISTVTGEPLTDAEATDPAYWAQHARKMVRFSAAAEQLLQQGDYAVLEVGPGQALSQLVRQQQAKTAAHEFIPSLVPEGDGPLQALGRLWVTGVPVAWDGLHAEAKPRKVSLPTYPFERQRYFADLPAGMALPLVTAITDGTVPVEFVVVPVSGLNELDGHAEAPVEEAVPVVVEDPMDLLKKLLSDLSGMDISAAPEDATLLELGFDSLFISQVAVALTRKYGVKITFRQLLKELGTLGALAAYLPAPQARAAAGAQPKAAAVFTAPAVTTGHGPFRPVQRELKAEFTPDQEAWLQRFIQRYVARTAKSKEHTQKYRSVLADPRAVSGFKQIWKEMTYPIVVGHSSGANLWDVDGNEWIDITLSFGPAMFGHQPSWLVEAIEQQLRLGIEVGPTSPMAGEVAELLCELTGMERATFCNTGSEAILGALRVARTVTGRPKIAYFAEAYHGINDEVLGRPTPGGAAPLAPGIPPEMLENALILEYGEESALEEIARQAGDLAAVLVEPVQSRRPWLQPREFLHKLRALTQQHGIALIFDEVICGFRAAPGGAQQYFGVKADLATYGKVLGGGMPIGAIAGSAEYMDAFDGGAWQYGDDSFPGSAMTFFAGTFVRNPLALAAARAVLHRVREAGGKLQEDLTARTRAFMQRLNRVLVGTPFSAASFSSNWILRCSPDFPQGSLIHALLRDRGIHVWDHRPCFICTAHTDADLQKIESAVADSVRELREAGFFETPTTRAVPIVESQQELWLLCQQTARANTACNETWSLHLDGALNVAALQEAAGAVVDRHDALRSTIRRAGDLVDIRPPAGFDVPVLDLSRQPAAAQRERLHAMAVAESERVFDLQEGPLLKLELIRLSDRKHVLLFNAHHIVCDGWSCDVFLTELSRFYSAAQEGRDADLPPAFSLTQYQQWEQALRKSPEAAEDTAYWLDIFRHVPPLLEFPSDFPRPARRTYGGADETLTVSPALAERLQKLGAAHGATLFGVLFAGFQALLYRVTQQGDFAVGVPSAGQSLAEADHLIGHCVNLLPIRAKVEGSASFAALLKSVQASVVDGFDHRRLTFGTLLQKLVLPRSANRSPLISATFNLDPPLSDVHFAGLTHRLELNPRAAYQFDLGINCDTSVNGLRMVCHYNTDLFSPETIRHWLHVYCSLLGAAAQQPEQSIDELPFAATAAAEYLAPALKEAPTAQVALWPSSPASGGEQVYDDLLYNAMLVDHGRHDFFRKAIEGTVRGKIVVDLGTGRDALLARMCIEAGASKVYAVELLAQPATLAKALVERMGLSDRIIVICANALEVTLPEQGDICISENIGCIGGSEGGDRLLYEGLRRLLKSDGQVIPARVVTQVAAISMPAEFIERPAFEMIGGHYAKKAFQEAGYPHDFRLSAVGVTPELLASSSDVFEDIDLSAPTVRQYEREIALTISEDRTVDGLLCWLNITAPNGAMINTLDHLKDSWLPVYLPAFYPGIAVKKGDRIEATVRGEMTENGINRDYHLRGRIVRASGGEQPFEFSSYHYKQVYRATPFYDRLFRGDEIPIADSLETPAAEPGETVHGLFAEVARRTPQAIAVEDDKGALTYQQLDQLSNGIARELQALGVKQGSNVGICLERSAQFVAAMLGVLKTGGAYVPLDPAYPQERLSQMVRDANVRVAVSNQTLSGPLFANGIAVLDVNQSAAPQPDANFPAVASRDAAYVMFTSGSTGTPKGSEIPHSGITRLVRETNYVSFSPSDVVAQGSNISFDAATFEIWGALLNGARLSILPPKSTLEAATLGRELRERKVSVLFLTTPLFHQLAHTDPALFGGLEYLVVGGDALDPRSARAVLESGKAPRHLVNGYGPTETTTFAICHQVTEVAEDAESVPIGRPISKTPVYLLDTARQPVVAGEIGEIFIGGPGVALGYVNQPEMTAERFLHDPFVHEAGARMYRTGDLARLLPDGAIEFAGRIDDQVKIRGFRVEPREIEAALRQHPNVRECKVQAVQNSAGDKALVGYVAPLNCAPLTEVNLRQFLAARLPEYLVPSSFVVMPKLPLTPTGKLALQQLPVSEVPVPKSAASAQNAVQAHLIEIWEEMLGRRGIGVRDNFFELGGHSLLAARMLSLIHERLGQSVDFSTLFENPTIEKVAERLLRDQQVAAEKEPFIRIHPKGKRRPFFFLHGDYVGGGFFSRTLAERIGTDRPFYAIHPHGLHGDHLPISICAMAADRLATIRRLQPNGPYMLGGYCNGAMVAFEMARQLEREGEKVSALIMLMADGSNYQLRGLDRWTGLLSTVLHDDEAGRQRRFLAWRSRDEFTRAWARHKAATLGALLKKPLPEVATRFWRKLERIAQRLTARQAPATVEHPTPRAVLSGVFGNAAASYIPAHYSGEVTLLWPADEVPIAPDAEAFGWTEVSGRVALHKVPGGHHTCVSRVDNVRASGEVMREVLDLADPATPGAAPVHPAVYAS